MIGNLLQPEFEEMIAAKQWADLANIMKELDASDVAELIEDLPAEQEGVVFRVLPRDRAGAVFSYLPRETQESLVLSLTVAYVWPLFVAIGAAQNQAFGYLGYLTPWSFKWWLFSERAWMVGVGALAMLGFTALLVWFGLSRFKKRDL